MIRWNYTGNGFWELEAEGESILKAYAYGESADGHRVDTRTAELTLKAWDMETSQMVLRFSGNEGLALVERLRVSASGVALADCELQSVNMREVVETRLLTPLAFSAPDRTAGDMYSAVWTDMRRKMLVVPYGNTMWLRWEASPLQAARMSCEGTSSARRKAGRVRWNVSKLALIAE